MHSRYKKKKKQQNVYFETIKNTKTKSSIEICSNKLLEMAYFDYK